MRKLKSECHVRHISYARVSLRDRGQRWNEEGQRRRRTIAATQLHCADERTQLELAPQHSRSPTCARAPLQLQRFLLGAFPWRPLPIIMHLSNLKMYFPSRVVRKIHFHAFSRLQEMHGGARGLALLWVLLSSALHLPACLMQGAEDANPKMVIRNASSILRRSRKSRLPVDGCYGRLLLEKAIAHGATPGSSSGRAAASVPCFVFPPAHFCPCAESTRTQLCLPHHGS